ncbi:MAG TPA: hypothetical protein VFV94_01735, partial [Polyangiaceae bacterium]|nr:hypothetical protein [Polyangiaceae bacterium]
MPSFSLARRARSGLRSGARPLGVGAALATCVALGCSGGTAPNGPTEDGRDAGGGEGGGSDSPEAVLSLRAVSLEDGQNVDPLKLAPNESVGLVATVKPAAVRDLRFALVGDPFDAVLRTSTATTSGLTGIAQNTLTAPSVPKSFSVRVTSPGAAPEFLALAVPSTGLTDLGVTPSYDGLRTVTQYTATAWANTTCADLTGAPPDDGSVVSTADTFPVPLEVPANVPLAVILRVGKYIWGCTTQDAAAEGAVTPVVVELTDVPIKLDRSQIRFTLSLDRTTPFTDALAPSRAALLAAVAGEASDDVEALLDAMHDALDDPSSFESTRRAETWDRELRATLPNAAELVRGPFGVLLANGVDALHFDQTLVGALTGAGVGVAPELTLESVLGMPPELATFYGTGDTVWSTQADDTVLVGMSLEFDAGGFLLGAATDPALGDAPLAADLGEALELAVPCKTLAATLVAHGE